jgi:hypothetical protein
MNHRWIDVPGKCYGNSHGGVSGTQACAKCGCRREFVSSPGQLVRYTESDREYHTEGGESLLPPGESACEG